MSWKTSLAKFLVRDNSSALFSWAVQSLHLSAPNRFYQDEAEANVLWNAISSSHPELREWLLKHKYVLMRAYLANQREATRGALLEWEWIERKLGVLTNTGKEKELVGALSENPEISTKEEMMKEFKSKRNEKE